MELSIAVSGEGTENQRGLKKFERATMTRIGRYQVRFPDFTGNASYRRDKLAPLKIFQTKLRQSVNGARVYAENA